MAVSRLVANPKNPSMLAIAFGIVAMLMAFVFAIGFVAEQKAFADTATDNGIAYQYSVTSGKATITKGEGAAKAVSIPSTLGGYPVTSIGNQAFLECSEITSVNIPSGVTSIGGMAFRECTSMTSVTFPEGLVSIGEQAFYGCENLEAVSLPDSVSSLGKDVFENCHKVKTVRLPSTLTSIPSYAFQGCHSIKSMDIPSTIRQIGYEAFARCLSLESICIPAATSSIDESAFNFCYALKSIEVDPGNGFYSSLDNALYDKFKTVLMQYAAASPAASLSIPDTVKEIAAYSFIRSSNLKTVIIPSSMQSIQRGAFTECSSLAQVSLPDSITSLGMDVFYKCSSLRSATLPSYLDSIPHSLFYGCASLASITIPNSVTTIEGYAFQECESLSSISIPEGVTRIGEQAFCRCYSLSSVSMPDSVTSMGAGAFFYCRSLSSITLPNSLSVLPVSTFAHCTGLQTVTIGSGTSSIVGGAFLDCGSLKNIILANGNSSFKLQDGVLYTSNSSTLVVYPAGLPAKQFAVPGYVSSMQSYAFHACSNLVYVSLPEGLSSIESCVFNDAKNLVSIAIPESVSTIGSLAFGGCTSLEDVFIAKNITSVEAYSFNQCPITDVYFSGTQAEWNTFRQSVYVNEFESAEIHFNSTGLGTKCFPAVAATCTSPGTKAFYRKDGRYYEDAGCSSSKEIANIDIWKVVPAKGHTPKILKGGPSTCLHRGYSDAQVCSVCGKVLVSSKELPLGNHDGFSYVNSAGIGVDGEKATMCTTCGKTISRQRIPAIASIVPSTARFVYDGKKKTPSVIVKDSSGAAIAGFNYTVSPMTDCVRVGTHSIDVDFKGNYSGLANISFDINPAGTSVTKVKSSKKKTLTVSWKKQATQTSGYEIAYSTSSAKDASGKLKSAKTAKVANSKTSSTTIKKLKSGKKYYLQIRTYMNCNGKKYASTWSAPKNAKVK